MGDSQEDRKGQIGVDVPYCWEPYMFWAVKGRERERENRERYDYT